ncbi:Uncharacterized protein HZ326_17016 [Fusarium oxysporum f. sp. albedinis]|nr:Uncharacterized protein HZ326_17016 [Fusarium oxysporum f. sp. albedinis]
MAGGIAFRRNPKANLGFHHHNHHPKASCTRTDRDKHHHQRTGAAQTLGFSIEFWFGSLAMQDATTERGGADLAQMVGERMELDRDAEDQPGLHSRQFQGAKTWATSGESYHIGIDKNLLEYREEKASSANLCIGVVSSHAERNKKHRPFFGSDSEFLHSFSRDGVS